MTSSGSTRAASPDRRRWYALIVLVMAQFIVILDGAIVNVALPSIQSALDFSSENLHWVITAYAITFGGLLLLGGRLADSLGRRRMFIVGVTIFTAASLLNGLAWDDVSLIAFRGLQGIGAALLTPAALSLLVNTFTDTRERNLALGVWGAAVGSGGATGLLLGGVLTEVDWRWIFFINIPFGVAVVALTPLFVRESRSATAARSFDVAGAISSVAGLGLLVYGLTYAAGHGWTSPVSGALIAGAVVVLAAFVAIEARSQEPLLPLRLFRLRTLSGSNLAMVLASGAAFVVFLLGTLYMQQVLGYSPVETGLAFLAVTATILVVAGPVQGVVARIGVRTLMSAGFVIMALGVAWLARMPLDANYWVDLLPGLTALGVGSALVFVPGQIGAQSGVAAGDSGVASGLINTSQQIGGAIGVAAGTTIATVFTSSFVDSNPGAAPDAALVHGFSAAYWVFAGVLAAGALITWMLVERNPPVAEDGETAAVHALA
jgi:EmrB/QacA subfamily drug resistance transporter